MTAWARTVDSRPLILIIGTGQRHYREYLLASISTEYRVHLFLGGEPTWEREYAAGWTILPSTLEVDVLVAAARELAAGAVIDGVLCWDEARILQTAEVASALGLPGGDPPAVRSCRDKHMTRQALAAAGIPQPASVLVGSVEEALAAAAGIGYPVVLKPRALAASLGVVKVADPAELVERFAFASETTVPEAPSYEKAVMVEEFAEGDEISIDCALQHGRVLPLFVARKEKGFPPYFEEVGHYVDGGDELLTGSQMQALLSRTHSALGLTDGMTHCEVMLTAAGPKVIEVNARLGGDMIPYLGQCATGIEPGLVAAAVACGRVPRVRPRRTLVGAVRFCYARGSVADLDLDLCDVTFPPGGLDLRDGGLPAEGLSLREAALPPEVDRFQALLGPHHLSLFPAGTVPGRIAYITAVADSAEECRRALDQATDALDVLPHIAVKCSA
jgi:carbamoylphosphate synthase large subunit